MQFKIREGEIGPFIGQKGFYIKFLNELFNKLIGIGAKAIEVKRRKALQI